MLVAFGLLLGFGMGVTLGFIGAGGSILTVPILVYFFGIKPLTATGYSLLLVGLVALTGAIRYSKQQMVDVWSALLFSLPAMCMVLFTRRFIIPSIPDPLFHFESFFLSKDAFLMILFGLLMLASAFFMFKREDLPQSMISNGGYPMRAKTLVLITASSGIGLLTGMIGAGGGFLIVPTLIALYRLPIKMAVGTSLTIITINSLVGFSGDLMRGFSINWVLLFTFLATTTLGMIVGTTLNGRMRPSKLYKTFALFTLVLGLIILGDQVFQICQQCFQKESIF